ncbi:hypothetical protein F0562_019135 [Nyssa sinensis]|uniref:BEACH domain-containing protein n=1 Tax=Nyssa sinensis TaxID=561372 RepID=A0A5J4ZE08_9ASTE|nr:hypothetical protein F0562_019135 [Nyssa sinensis]
MERWARWEINNFEYLMQLNTLAGRSYNDITQYPVFPWILSDYSSKSLDLANPSSYRDLSKPIGALNADRLKKFQEKYSSFDDPVIPKFHYGSHYSSARTVLYYLVRVEPFTTLSIQLQGGNFDHEDRMFSDIAATWNGVLEDMSDVKELVPELFYLPEILTNENSIDFGTTQLEEKLDSVRLPPWAENPVDFIHKHRMALESEHVSACLHEWIDLIFGYKQRGKEAIVANNVFFYITYEGTVDIDKISDPVQLRATQDQIAYFGQTPSQLLTVPHLRKMPLADVLQLQTIFRNPKEVKPYVVPFPECCNLPAAAIHASSDSVVIVDINAPAAHVAQYKWQPNTPDHKGTPFLFQHGKASAGSTGGTFMRMFKGPSSSGSEDWQFPQALAFATSGIRSSSIISITCDKEIIIGGYVDNSVRLISSDGAKTLETARGHCAPVTCLALSPDSNYLVTGSRDTTVLLWRIHRASTSHSSSVSEPSTGSGTPTSTSSNTMANISIVKSRRCRIEGPIHVLRGHLGEIICCCVSSDLGIVVSCSNSLDVLLHSIRRGRLIRRLVGVEAHAVGLSSDGIIMCSEIDGACDNSRQFKSKKSGIEYPDAESDETSEDNRLDVPSPSIYFLDMHTLKVFHTLKLGEGQDITALALNKDNTNLLVSTADKQLIIFTDPALSLKVADQMLKLHREVCSLLRGCNICIHKQKNSIYDESETLDLPEKRHSKDELDAKATAIKGKANDGQLTQQHMDRGDEIVEDNTLEKRKKTRKRKRVNDLRFEMAKELGGVGLKRRERKKKYLEARKKKHKKINAEESLDFPGHEEIKFGEVVQAPPKLVAIPKAFKTAQHASQERLRLEAVQTYRNRKGWASRPGIHLPAPEITSPSL